jgi:hypothetical protein
LIACEASRQEVVLRPIAAEVSDVATGWHAYSTVTDFARLRGLSTS